MDLDKRIILTIDSQIPYYLRHFIAERTRSYRQPFLWIFLSRILAKKVKKFPLLSVEGFQVIIGVYSGIEQTFSLSQAISLSYFLPLTVANTVALSVRFSVRMKE